MVRAIVCLALGLPAALLAQATSLQTQPAFPFAFNQPLAIVSPPGETNRLFIVERQGRIVVIPDLAHPTRSVFLDITSRVGSTAGEQGLLALAFHPDFRNNRQFYVWYACDGPQGRFDRLARYLVSATDENVADANSEQILISQPDGASNHNGGELLFGPDGYLYVSVGDEGGSNDAFQNSQRIDKDFFSGILRLDVDRRAGNLAPNGHPAVQPGTYSIPADNPFVGAGVFNGQAVDPSRVRTEFWAVGLRNPWRMALDAETGVLWCADVGQNAREEVDIIVRGGNYGWSYREGAIAGPRGAPPASAQFIAPVWDYPHSEGVSVTGGLVYRGDRYPSLNGKYIFGDYGSGRIWVLAPDGDRPVGAERVSPIAQVPTIASFGLDPSTGDLLVASLESGVIRLVAPLNRLINLSSRAQVGTGADILIPSFIIGAGSSKQVLVRAIGPSLAPLGVSGFLAETAMELRAFASGQLVGSNTGWGTAPNAGEIRAAAARLGAFALPESSADSAILATLAPGAYTVPTRGVADRTGIALVEVYDAEPLGGPRLINLGTRALVGSDAAIVITGVIISGTAPKTLLIRGVGPGLLRFSVPGTLAQPVLTLYSGAQALQSNAGWNTASNASGIRSAAAQVGAFALDEGGKDSALLASLDPGAYTIQVSGANGTTGVVLVELYEVP